MRSKKYWVRNTVTLSCIELTPKQIVINIGGPNYYIRVNASQNTVKILKKLPTMSRIEWSIIIVERNIEHRNVTKTTATLYLKCCHRYKENENYDVTM